MTKILIPTEYQEGVALVRWANAKNIPLVHIPNEGKRSYTAAAMLRKTGLRKGFPDYFLPHVTSQYAGLFVELKRTRNSKASIEQLQWIDELNTRGYRATIAKGFDEAKQIIEEYLG